MTRTLSALIGFALVAPLASAQVFSTNQVAPIGDLQTAQSSITVAGGPALITDVNIILNIDHPSAGQLDIVLVPPSGNAYVHLVSDIGGNDDDFMWTRFDQQSPVPVTSGPPLAVTPYSASFRPIGGSVDWRSGAGVPLPGPAIANLDALNGTNANGTWTLLVDDDSSGNAGRILNWALEFNGASDPRGPRFGAPPSIDSGACVPNAVVEGQSGVFTVHVVPGSAPASPVIQVIGDASFVGGPARVDFNDAGLDGDAVAGDFNYSATIPLGAFPGNRAICVRVMDAMFRASKFEVPFVITATPSGACCMLSGCQVLREFVCAQNAGVFTQGIDCQHGTYTIENGSAQFLPISTLGMRLANSDNDDMLAFVDIGFPFEYYGVEFSRVGVSSNGNIQFAPSDSNRWLNVSFPNTTTPNNMIAPLWDDFDLGPQGSGDVYAYLDASGPQLAFVVSWEGVERYPGLNDSNSFQVIIYEDSSFEFRYGAIAPSSSTATASVGFENAGGTVGQNISFAGLGSGNTSRRIIFNDTGSPCIPPVCPPCAADYDENGGTDGGDLAAFFVDFEQGFPCADVDQNGGIDGGDIGTFFQVFEAGGC